MTLLLLACSKKLDKMLAARGGAYLPCEQTVEHLSCAMLKVGC
jgi:hypothetical protein